MRMDIIKCHFASGSDRNMSGKDTPASSSELFMKVRFAS